jgi:two-component system chemotaxis response regulator CheB
MPKPIRVLIVDDSRFIQKMFSHILSEAQDIEVLDVANDAYDAREKIKSLNPDVITLDIEMPKMDGLSFLEKIMTLRPMPVVMVSTLTQKGADATLRALEIGAVDYVSKPAENTNQNIHQIGEQLVAAVRAAARANVRGHRYAPNKDAGKPKPLAIKNPASNHIIAIGSSTGGVEALRDIIPKLPTSCPAIVMTQHMPAQFTQTFAERLNGLAHITVHEAEDGMPLERGHAYLAPGSHHLAVKPAPGGSLICHLDDGPLMTGHKPSVDVLFASAAEHIKKRAIGVILTGMGKDGAKGLLQMKEAGANTIGQNEQSCVVYGMPKAAKLNGGVDREISLEHIAQNILNLCD